MNTPEYAHNQCIKFNKQWKNYYRNNKNNEQKINSFVQPNEAMVKL